MNGLKEVATNGELVGRMLGDLTNAGINVAKGLGGYFNALKTSYVQTVLGPKAVTQEKDRALTLGEQMAIRIKNKETFQVTLPDHTIMKFIDGIAQEE